MRKKYLGDGVYVECESNMLVLTSENGIEVLNTIYLEDSVFRALVDYVQQLTYISEEEHEEY